MVFNSKKLKPGASRGGPGRGSCPDPQRLCGDRTGRGGGAGNVRPDTAHVASASHLQEAGRPGPAPLLSRGRPLGSAPTVGRRDSCPDPFEMKMGDF